MFDGPQQPQKASMPCPLAPRKLQVAVEGVGLDAVLAGVRHAQQSVGRHGHVEIRAGHDEAGIPRDGSRLPMLSQQLAAGIVMPDDQRRRRRQTRPLPASGDRGQHGAFAGAGPRPPGACLAVKDLDVVPHAHVEAAGKGVLGIAHRQAVRLVLQRDFLELLAVGSEDCERPCRRPRECGPRGRRPRARTSLMPTGISAFCR